MNQGALIRLMVINRLCDPESKPGVLRWLQTVALPDLAIKAIEHQHLLRAMDALVVARTMGAKRDGVIGELEKKASEWTDKLDEQELEKKARGRKTSDGGVRARFYRAVSEAHLSKIILVDLKSELFAWSIDERALALAEIMDGKLLLVTNATDLSQAEVLVRYKSLADIERGFRVYGFGQVSHNRAGCTNPLAHRNP
jgi:hypothetical protein